MTYTINMTGLSWSRAVSNVHKVMLKQVLSKREIETYYGVQYVNPDGIKDTVEVTFPSETHYAFFLLKAF